MLNECLTAGSDAVRIGLETCYLQLIKNIQWKKISLPVICIEIFA